MVVKEKYFDGINSYPRRKTRTVNIGNIPLGSKFPIRVQSMTTTNTMDVEATVNQSIRMIEAGCEYVRITAPSIKEAKMLSVIKKKIINNGYNTPIIADIHFTPNAAIEAARHVQKVRINPGNFADRKKFKVIEYTDQSYNDEIDRIYNKFSPLVEVCKLEGCAMRIGVNHGSLSDRILSRYGDTPIGMVESAMEFLRICEDLNYKNIVLSMKSSNTRIMVQAYRLLVSKMNFENMYYPLHLGVTEAGEGEDGRIKSAVGIGTLLEDGLGDTIRVSLTEDPEYEIPVAKALLSKFNKGEINFQKNIENNVINPFEYCKRKSISIHNIGKNNVPRVIIDLSNIINYEKDALKELGYIYNDKYDKWVINDLACDFIYLGSNSIDFSLPGSLGIIQDYFVWSKNNRINTFPLMTVKQYSMIGEKHPQLNFIITDANDFKLDLIKKIDNDSTAVLILNSDSAYGLFEQRGCFIELINNNLKIPVIICRTYNNKELETFQLYSATDIGALLLDGLGDGVFLKCSKETLLSDINRTSFGILQASRTRISKTEYISCPSCGRTLFDLQKTTAMVREKTNHLKGVKIGIMGCIVNGPGEMADADYGYVGTGIGKISLYRGQKVVRSNIPTDKAVDSLIDLMKEDGVWIDPEKIEA